MVRLRERETEINKIKPKIAVPQGHYHPKITKISVGGGKITAFLADQREISLPTDLIIKEWFHRPDIKLEQLKNYKIWGGGHTVLFSDIDESIPVRVFTEGINSPCCC
jgi:hypothetical protein